eukprot:TRINITY_DN91627_c0_g1_i1.p1 TRINITY_DN91627_c0_g1~~TRINITY_DN91627_c0_g1_i1.p1  ORF type:complete len:224 (-),score=49.95 TRINITY_DN91627_c0_g1_i1:86-757(-)
MASPPQRLLALAAALVACLPQTSVADKDNIVKLTKFNFDDNVKHGSWFVKFYAPWCTHCQRLAPIWEKLADQAVAKDWPVKIAEVDCTVSNSICDKAGIKAFPTLALIADGALKSKYHGDASVDAFQTWLSSQNVLQDGSPGTVKKEEGSTAGQKLTEEKTTSGASTTHAKALKALLQNLVARYPTQDLVVNMYFYVFVGIVLVVVFYCVVFEALPEEQEKED